MRAACSCPDGPGGERALREVSALRQPRGWPGLLPPFPVPDCVPVCHGDRTPESDEVCVPSVLLATRPAPRTPGLIGRRGGGGGTQMLKGVITGAPVTLSESSNAPGLSVPSDQLKMTATRDSEGC